MPTERNPHPDDAGIEELLREVGARAEPSVEMSRAVGDAVHAEWRALIEQRRRLRRNATWAVAASAVLAIGIGVVTIRGGGFGAVEVASIARVDGHLLAGPQEEQLEIRSAGTPIRQGEVLRTDDRSRVALGLARGMSVRMDHDTTIEFVSVDAIELRSGALYVDAPQGRRSTDLAVQTRVGTVRHVGTQYQVRTHADDIAVSVREGRVQIEHGQGTSNAVAGERVRITTRGETARAAISPRDPSWAWATRTAPPFAIDNQSLAAFLDWLARETGRRVVYASPQARAAAQTVKLRGSIAGLDLDTALGAVLSTTQLRQYDTGQQAIGIALAHANDPAGVSRPTQ